ncbi:hypothetical protein D9C73_001449 [Collichthys lucidus]|uniref:Uncharacterized protein n=1 Tax=Collichthys lucidus TaxID=240159 RepID=A0A4U5U0N2_COLLU|nr:hypothetical protein D9C73_001449 [Collichthys lucidus]
MRRASSSCQRFGHLLEEKQQTVENKSSDEAAAENSSPAGPSAQAAQQPRRQPVLQPAKFKSKCWMEKMSTTNYCQLRSQSPRMSTRLPPPPTLSSGPLGSASLERRGTDSAFEALTPAFSLIRLRKSSSLLFFLIKSDNIWRAGEGRFNVANVTAGVILAILAICFVCSTFIEAPSKAAASNAVIQSFKKPPI